MTSGNAFVGELGAGKTLALTYLAYRNYLKYEMELENAKKNKIEIVKTIAETIELESQGLQEGIDFVLKKRVHANYKLNFPFVPVKSINDIMEMESGFFAGDELWSWIDARSSASRKNQIASGIILKSRKREVHISFTTQNFRQIDSRIRGICDFVAKPAMTPKEDICRLIVLSNPSLSLVKQPYVFHTAPYFRLYNTREEIAPLIFSDAFILPQLTKDNIEMIMRALQKYTKEEEDKEDKKEAKKLYRKFKKKNPTLNI